MFEMVKLEKHMKEAYKINKAFTATNWYVIISKA